MVRPLALILILVVINPLAFMPAAHGTVTIKASSSETGPAQSFSSSDPLQIFLYVRNNFIFEPYYGFMKGVNGTLNAGGGNDYDQAAVLVHLLRQANVQARYVEGTINLNMSAAENWLGVETENATLRLLDQAAIPYTIQDAGGATSVQVQHVWVEAYLNGAWVEMDPSFKQYTYHKSRIAFPQGLQLAPLPNGTSVGPYGVAKIDTNQILRSIEYVQEKALQAVQDLGAAGPTASRTIKPVEEYSAPPGGEIGSVYDEIPTSRQFYVEFTIPAFDPAINDFTFARNVTVRYPTTALSESRVTLYYVPVDNQTLKYIQSFPDLLDDPNLNPRKVEMFPILRLNGTYRIIGEAMPLGYRMPLQAGVLWPVGENGRRYVNSGTFTPQVGTWNSLTINTGDSYLNDTILQHRREQLNDTLQASGQRPTPVDDILGAMLDMHGRIYNDLVNHLSLSLQNALSVRRAGSKVGIALYGFRYDWAGSDETGWHLRYAGPYMDWEVGGWQAPISTKDDRGPEVIYTVMERSIESILEGQVIYLLYGIPPVSTLTILEAANEQGIPIFIIDKNNWDAVIPQLSQPSDVISTIRNSVNEGLSVIIPQRQVTTTAITLTISENIAPPEKLGTYTGTAWLVLNARTLDIPGWRIYRTSVTGSAWANSSSQFEGGDSGVSFGPCSCWSQEDMIKGVFDTAEEKAEWTRKIMSHAFEGPTPLSLYDFLVPTDFLEEPPVHTMYDRLSSYMSGYNHVPNGAMKLFTGRWTEFVDASVGAAVGNNLGTQISTFSLTPYALRINENSHDRALVQATTDAAPYSYHSALVATLDTTFLVQYDLERYFANLAHPPTTVSTDTSFAMALVDEDGHGTGVDPLTMKTCFGTNYVYEHSVTTKDQTIGLWNLPAGNYTILLSSKANQPLSMVLTDYTWEGTAYRLQSSDMQIPSGSSVAVSLSVSYDPKGGMSVNLGSPLPAAFIHLDQPENSTVHGQLLDGSRNGVAGGEVQFYYRPSLIGTGWTYIDSKTTSADGSFILDWTGAPPGESTLMATYRGMFRAFTTVNIPFMVTVNLRNLEGVPLPDGPITITANNKTVTAPIRGGSASFEAFPGYNLIAISPTARNLVFIPVPTSAITVQFDVPIVTSTATSTASTSPFASTTAPLAMPAGLQNTAIIASVAAVAALVIAALIVKKRQNSKRIKEGRPPA
jgi:hypothetical protein